LIAVATAPQPTEHDFEIHRRELTGYCYRMLGSGFEAEDAVQETMVRAWRGAASLHETAAMRSWLYRIATNVCLDMLGGAQRRALPMEIGDLTTTDRPNLTEVPAHAWVQPVPDAWVLPADAEGADPADLVTTRETIRLAFVGAIQHLPPRQRAVLVLREVLRFQATEVAELLDTSVASVNSALQRARATLDSLDLDAGGVAAALDEGEQQELVARYVDAFVRYDIDELVSLLSEDAAYTMPPHPMWLRGPEESKRWMLGPGAACRGSRILTTSANGIPAAATYKPAPDGGHEPFALILIETGGGRITALHHYLFGELFEQFGLPARLDAEPT
jgi:RNA polymerase sigma-70 factor, ECF subfamily